MYLHQKKDYGDCDLILIFTLYRILISMATMVADPDSGLLGFQKPALLLSKKNEGREHWGPS